MKFEWDKRKNNKNIEKHGISFEEAAFVFSDIEAISIPDEYHSDFEERWITIGKIKNRGVIVAREVTGNNLPNIAPDFGLYSRRGKSVYIEIFASCRNTEYGAKDKQEWVEYFL